MSVGHSDVAHMPALGAQERGVSGAVAVVARFCLDRLALALRGVSDPLTANDSADEAGVSLYGFCCPVSLSPRGLHSLAVDWPLGF